MFLLVWRGLVQLDQSQWLLEVSFSVIALVLQEIFLAAWKYFVVSSEPAVGKRQLTYSDLDSRLELPVSLFGRLALQVHLLLDGR